MVDHRLPDPHDAHDHYVARVHDPDDHDADHDHLSPYVEYMLALGYVYDDFQSEPQDDDA